MKLTAIILTYNEAAHIMDCIESVRFADDVLIFDSFSKDNTLDLAQKAGARVLQHTFKNYADQRNTALATVTGSTDWVLFVDADERVTPALAAEINTVLGKSEYAGWRIPRHNYIFGKLTRGAGWFPDYQTRLLRVGKSRYDPERQVHELVLLEGELGTLKEPFIHYNYQNVTQFHAKQRRYSDYDARILFESGIRPKPQNYVLQPWRQFWWRFWTLQGYQDGLHGLHLSLLLGWYEFRKYLRLKALWGARTAAP
ncbi:MAG: glycosyltransferase family 2 protein [Anaerolineae bacterium]|nr:glycosyltransferase family 2 protein [Anaerolineae bacterium]